jgi:hypothetical protein
MHARDLRNCLSDVGLQTFVFYDNSLAVVAQKFIALQSEDLDLGVFTQLSEDILESPAAEIELILIENVEAERPSLGLIAIGGQKVKYSGLIQILI